jgi:hypothetical protein
VPEPAHELLGDWAERYVNYVKALATEHCATRLADYRLAGRLRADTPLLAFSGRAGGRPTLLKHKTAAKVGTRYIPLSMYAAQILARRTASFGMGLLFPDLTSKDWVCKSFDAACTLLSINDNLLIKDFRRAFINRNKAHVPNWTSSTSSATPRCCRRL